MFHYYFSLSICARSCFGSVRVGVDGADDLHLYVSDFFLFKHFFFFFYEHHYVFEDSLANKESPFLIKI